MQCTLYCKVQQALERHSERPAEPKRLGAAHGTPDPSLFPSRSRTAPYVAARYNDLRFCCGPVCPLGRPLQGECSGPSKPTATAAIGC